MSRQLFGVVVGTLVAIATLALGAGASSAAPTRSPMPNPVCARHPDACRLRLPGHWECWGSLFEFVNVPDGPTYEVLRNNTLIDTIPHVAGREAYGIRAGVPILT